MTITHVDPATDPRWRALVDARRASLFHSPPWMEAVAATYGFELRAALLLDHPHASVPRAGMTYCVLDDELGTRVVSLPFTDACDPLVGSGADWAEVADAIIHRAGPDLPWSVRCLDDEHVAADARFTVSRRARWHRLDLRDSADEVWAASAGSFRRAVRKAWTNDVEVRPMRAASDIEAFATLHRRLRRTKYGMLSQPTAFFGALRDQFAPLGAWHPLGAFHGDRLVAMTVYLRFGDTLFYKFNASDPDALDTRPNNLLLWEGAALARDLGCRTVDLGPSDDHQPGLIRFKAQSGAAVGELTGRTWNPSIRPAAAAGDRLRATLGDLTRLFIAPEVPDEVTRDAGGALYRWFA